MNPKEKAKHYKETFGDFAVVIVDEIINSYLAKQRKNIKQRLYVNGTWWGWWNTFIWKLFKLSRVELSYWIEVRQEIKNIEKLKNK